LPKLDVNIKSPKIGDRVELICQVRYLPKRFELNWVFNDRKISVPVNHTNSSARKSHKVRNLGEIRETEVHYHKKRTDMSGETLNPPFFSSDLHHHKSFQIFNENHSNNVTISRLVIHDIKEHHKGVYKCRYDKIEGKINLDLKTIYNPKTKTKTLGFTLSNSSRSSYALNSDLMTRYFSFFMFSFLTFSIYRFDQF
jgi:hypothetical protein